MRRTILAEWLSTSPEELRHLLLEVIFGAAGGDEAKWRKALGDVEKMPIATHA